MSSQTAVPPLPQHLSSPRAQADDFDFFHGRWRVEHRRLQRRLSACNEWDVFPGTSECCPILNGAGNVDDNIIDLPSGRYRAVTLRSFDPQSRQWAIWWLDDRNPHSLDVPVVGGFAAGVGTFYAEDALDSVPIIVRFQWMVGPSPVWEQAFSNDGGASWETNWTMHFTADPAVTLT